MLWFLAFRRQYVLFCIAVLLSLWLGSNDGSSEAGSPPSSSDSEPTDPKTEATDQNPTLAEARQRAKILYETIHGALQVMHRDFFDRDEGLKIPSHSLEDVFKELKRQYDVEMRWLAINTQAMNVDHKPSSDFELAAAQAIQNGKAEFESIRPERYQFVGRIRLSATCLSCHAPKRSSNDDRSAGLLIAFPIKPDQPQDEEK